MSKLVRKNIRMSPEVAKFYEEKAIPNFYISILMFTLCPVQQVCEDRPTHTRTPARVECGSSCLRPHG